MSFDERAAEWDNDPMRHERAKAVATAMRQRVPLNKTILALEYGCGTGLLSFALQSDLGEIVLADNSLGMLQVLKEKIAVANLTHLHPLHLDLLTDPLPTQRFDLIYTMLTLHHILDLNRILLAFHDLLKPNGYLCIADLDKEDGSYHRQPFIGHHGFDRQELGSLVNKNGFTDIVFDTVYIITRFLAGEEKQYPLFLMTARRQHT